MAANNVNFPAADASDVLAVQVDNNPSGASQTVAIRGYPVDIGGYQASLKVTNTQVGEFTGNH